MKADEPTPDAREIARAISRAAISESVLESIAEALLRLPGGVCDAATTLADAVGGGLDNLLISSVEIDRAGKVAGPTDGLFAIARALEQVAKALEGRKP